MAITNENEEIPELKSMKYDKNSEIKEYNELVGKKIYKIEIELSGEVKYTSHPKFILSDNGKMQKKFYR